MRVATVPRVLATVLGVAAIATTGYLILRGPFFDGPTLEPTHLMVALGGFVVGIIVFVWGATRMVDVKSV